MREVVMPKSSMTMTEGELTRWVLPDGSEVAEGDPIAEIMTDKVDMEIEAPSDGRLGVLVEAGTAIPVGTVIGFILAPGESKPEGDGPPSAPPLVPIPDGTPATEAPASNASATSAPRATPSARAMAKRLKVDLSRVRGTGPGGRIKPEDIAAFDESSPAPEAVVREVSMAVRSRQRPTGVRGVMARRMAAAASIPQFTVFLPVSFAAAEMARREIAESWDTRVSVTDLILRALAVALEEHPDLNAHFIEGEIVRYRSINLGVATDTESGLIVPVLRGAENLDLRSAVQRAAELIARARSGTLQPEEASGATFTVTNLGMFGIEMFQPVIDPPQVAILSAGRIAGDPGRIATLGLAADHRAVDGVQAAGFLQRVRELLERPDAELIRSRDA